MKLKLKLELELKLGAGEGVEVEVFFLKSKLGVCANPTSSKNELAKQLVMGREKYEMAQEQM